MKIYAALAFATLLVGCNPQLNWREVQLGRLTTLLPCKPDVASRPINFATHHVTMDMAGCQAGTSLYAISKIGIDNTVDTAATMAALREATLANIGKPVVHPSPNTGNAQTSYDVLVDGQNTDGTALQARLKWLVLGQEVYQIAIYAERLSKDQTDNFLNEVRLH